MFPRRSLQKAKPFLGNARRTEVEFLHSWGRDRFAQICGQIVCSSVARKGKREKASLPVKIRCLNEKNPLKRPRNEENIKRQTDPYGKAMKK